MTYPTQPAYGMVPKTRVYGPIEDMARDIEAMATALLGSEGNLTDGGAIVGDQAVAAGSFYTVAALVANTALTLPVAVTANSRILIMRSDTNAWTLALGAVFTMPASKAGIAILRADGVNWVLEHLVLDGKMVYTTTGHCKIAAAAAGSTITLAGNLTVNNGSLTCSPLAAGSSITMAGNITTTGGNVTLTVPVAGATINVAGNLTTTGGAATITVPVAGATISVAGNLTTTGAFNTTFAQAATTTVTLPAVNCTLAPGTALAPVVACPAQVGNDFIPLDIENGKTYVLGGATGAGSTVTLPAAAADGTRAYWILDGTLNGHAVTFRDATGPTAISAAITASKRCSAMITKLAGKWFIQYTESP